MNEYRVAGACIVAHRSSHTLYTLPGGGLQYIAGQVWHSHEGCDFIQKIFHWNEATTALGSCRGCDWGSLYISQFRNKKEFGDFVQNKDASACYKVPDVTSCPQKDNRDEAWRNEQTESGCCIPLSRVKCRVYIHGFKRAAEYKAASDWMNKPDNINQAGGPQLQPVEFN